MEDVDIIRRIGAARLSYLEARAITSAERWRRATPAPRPDRPADRSSLLLCAAHTRSENRFSRFSGSGCMAYRLGVDVGGTFTDLLLFEDSSGAFWRHKN